MSKQSDPLRTTAPELHRFWVRVRTEQQWYAVMAECRAWFGRDWRAQAKIRRRLRNNRQINPATGTVIPMPVWFEVPDLRICTWIATKFSLEVTARPPSDPGK